MFEQEVISLPKPNYEYITTEEQARTVLSDIARHNTIELDTETTSLDPYLGKMSLLQIGIPNKAYVFDVRSDTEHSSIGLDLFKPLLTDKSVLKLLQNAVFDMKYIKHHGGYYVENIYDTMLTEQLFYLGLGFVRTDLATLVKRYLGITFDKEPRGTFEDYGQTFEPYQLEYAANDVVILNLIRDLQKPRISKEGFENVCRLEFEFTKPMCEMELNGVLFDVEKHRIILDDIEQSRKKHGKAVTNFLNSTEDQTTLFGVSLINIDSNKQLLNALQKYGLNIDSTDVNVLDKFEGVPVIDELLAYRKAQKFISTYGESLIAKINEVTGRLHTAFRQMVSTGRMSSSTPNLQNIPKKQIYRSCYIAREGYKLITADMSSAEIRILGNFSADPAFVECYATGQDLHTKTAADVFSIPLDKVKHSDRNAAKALNFGLCVAEDTHIITDLGIDKIKDVALNSICGHDLGCDKVIDKQYMGAKEVFEIKTQYGYTLEVTKEHLIKVINKEGRYVDKELKDLDIKNDYVCIKNGSNIFPTTDFVFKPFYYPERTNCKKIDLPKKMDIDMAQFLGFFVAEGHLHKGRHGNYDAVQFGFSNKEKNLIKVIGDLFRRLFGDFYKYTEPDRVNYAMNSTVFANWLYSLFNFSEGDKTATIDIPICVKSSSKIIQRNFISAMFEGDGTIWQHGNSVRIKYDSKSYMLLKSLQVMLLNFGIVSSLKERPDKRYPNSNYYSLEIVGHKYKKLFIETIGFLTEYKNTKWACNQLYTKSCFTLPYQKVKAKNIRDKLRLIKNKTAKDNNNIRYLYNIINMTDKQGIGDFYIDQFSIYDDFIKFIYDNGIVPLTIKSITSKGIKKVYDLSIDNHQYFLANGFIVHNCYGLSKFGLARRLKISEKEAENMINQYFKKYSGVKRFLETTARQAVRKRYTTSISGRKRFYKLPEYGHPDFNNRRRAVEREGKNMRIQASNADTIKEAMIYVVDRLEGMESRLLLTVHDEVVVEAPDHEVEAARKIVSQSLIDGFGKYFSLIPMETDALVGDCWLKSSCENEVNGKECGGTVMESRPDDKYGKVTTCVRCGASQE